MVLCIVFAPAVEIVPTTSSAILVWVFWFFSFRCGGLRLCLAVRQRIFDFAFYEVRRLFAHRPKAVTLRHLIVAIYEVAVFAYPSDPPNKSLHGTPRGVLRGFGR
jgi:hypothetical protein